MKPYVILTEPRCGYQFLTSSLSTNPAVLALGEIFNVDRKVREHSMFGNDYPVIEEDQSSIDYVQGLMKYAADRNKEVVGFKLGYHCARSDRWTPLWEHMVDNSWRIIHLIRENLLDRVISHELALKERKWTDREYDSTIGIPANHLNQMCKRSMKFRKDAHNFFRFTPMITITYEQLVNNFDETTKGVQRYLGVKPIDLKVVLNKQQKRRQSEVLTNYVELYQECARNFPHLLKHFKEHLVV